MFHFHRCCSFMDVAVAVIDRFPLPDKINHSIYSIANCLFFAILKHLEPKPTKSSSFFVVENLHSNKYGCMHLLVVMTTKCSSSDCLKEMVIPCVPSAVPLTHKNIPLIFPLQAKNSHHPWYSKCAFKLGNPPRHIDHPSSCSLLQWDFVSVIKNAQTVIRLHKSAV